ncbi:MAG: ATP-binding protein [Janthinobacterium lividum]
MFGPTPRADAAQPGGGASRSNQTADTGREQVLAYRAFFIQKTVLRVAAAGSAILALMFILIVSVSDWQDRMATNAQFAMRSARVVEEHALKVLQLNEALEQQLVDYFAGFHDDRDFVRQEADIHDRLHAMALRVPTVGSIYVVNAQGTIIASSAVYPVPHVSVASQPYFRSAMVGDPLESVSRPFTGVVSHRWLFNTSARTRKDGRFDGVVSIGLYPDYFMAFYDATAGVAPEWRLRLSRIDGVILAEHLPGGSGATPGRVGNGVAGDAGPGSHGGVAAGADNAAVLEALGAGRTSGLFEPRSIFYGNDRLLAFRKVRGFPVFVSASISLAAIRAKWLRHVGLLAACLLAPCIVLWSVIAASLRGLAQSKRDWEQLQSEVAARKGVEEAYRQSLKMEALGRLVGNVAHEFNNLLMVVSANAQVARFADVVKVAPQIAAIERAVYDGQNLTRQLLGVARKQPLRAEPVGLREWLAVQQARLREVLGSGIALSWEAGDDCRIRVDPYEFELAVNNVARNARDAMPAGGNFAIGASTRWRSGADAPVLNGEFVCIALRDDGVGMEPAVLSRAFEPLFSTKAGGRGTGLGLPQVFAFCEQAGGLARIDSASGKGTTVYFYLPCDGAQAAQAGPPASDRDAGMAALTPVHLPDAPALHILLVEDDDAVAEANAELLMTMGHSVQRAINADAAMMLFAHGAGNAIEVVVSDIQMPGAMNGIDLAEHLAQAWPGLPVLLVTGYTGELERARQANRPVFSKPFDITSLDVMLRQIGARAR